MNKRTISIAIPVAMLTMLAIIAVTVWGANINDAGAQSTDPATPASAPAVTTRAFDANDAEVKAGTTSLSDVQNSHQRRSAEVLPLTDAHITQPRGVHGVFWPSTYAGQVDAYEIYRSVLPDGTASTERFVIKDDSEGYKHGWFFDDDLVPGKTYWWHVVAYLSAGGTVTFTESEGEANYADWLSADADANVITLRITEHRLPVSRVDLYRYEGNDANAPLVFWKSVDNDVGTEPDLGAVAGNYYRYRADYYDVAEGDEDVAELRVASEVVTAVVGEFTPSVPASLTAEYNAIGSQKLEWGESATHNSEIAYYQIDRLDYGETQYQSVGSTRELFLEDWEGVDDLFYTYRVTPVTYHGDNGPEIEIDVNRLDIICSDIINGNNRVLGFYLFAQNDVVDQYLGSGHESVWETNIHAVNASMSTARVGSLNTAWYCTDDVDVNDYEFRRRVVYHHGIDEAICGVADAAGLLDSCDLIGGAALQKSGPWEYSDVSQLSLGHIKYMRGLTFYHADAVKIMFHTDAPSELGLYRYEYKVCTKGRPPICSPPLFTPYGMEGIDSVPFTKTAAPAPTEEE